MNVKPIIPNVSLTGDPTAEPFAQLSKALDPGALLTDPRQWATYTRTTIASPTAPLAVVRPVSVAQIQRVVEVANRFHLALYPISRGKNWGYGSACAPCDRQIIVDLSAMADIEFDPELGLVTVGPGVSQRQLRDHLDSHGPDWLVPVTGAGPEASIVGNLLERGYGITPYSDHFAATTAIEAVLPDGSIYRTPLSRMGAQRADRAFKWGIGPYADGLFTQGAFGIVTAATVALAPRPEHIEAVFFSVRDDRSLEPTIERVRSILRRIGAGTGGVNLMNRRRVLAMTDPYPHGKVTRGELIPDALIEAMARRHRIGPWTGVAVLYGTRTIVKAARQEMHHQLSDVVSRFLFVSPGRLRRMRRLVGLLPGPMKRKPLRLLDTLDAAVANFSGTPSQVALPLAYWRSGVTPTDDASADPARDGCGLIWYSPLVPMTARDVRRYVEMVDCVCREHRIEPLITLTSLSDRCFDSTVPLLFDATDATETRRARECYDALFEAGRELGFLPYRVGIQAMGKVVDADDPYWKMIEKMKRAVDPNYIIAPGRYCPPDRPEEG